MAGLSKGRETPRMDNQAHPNSVGIGLAADAVIYIGALVCVDADGFAVAGDADNTLTAVGCAAKVQPDANRGGVPGKIIDNTGGDDGDLTVNVLRGTFKFDNDGTDPCEQADLFKVCYVVDDHTVSNDDDSAARPVAGYVVQIDEDGQTGAGVWVAVGQVSTSMI